MTQSLQTPGTLPLNQSPDSSMAQTMPNGAQTQSAPPLLKVTKKRAFSTGVANNVKQPVWLLRDKSSSMIGDKILELNLASHALLAELADPVNKDGFLLSVIDFNHLANSVISVKPASTLIMPDAIAGGSMNFVPVPGHWGTLPLSMKGAPNGTTSKNVHGRFQGRRG